MSIHANTTFEELRLELAQHARAAYRAMNALDGAIELTRRSAISSAFGLRC